MLSIILLFLTACTGDKTDELNKYLSLEWGLIASLTALITPIILIVFMYLLFKIKHLFYDFFIRTPYKTTKIFAIYYAFIPSLMMSFSLIIIWVDYQYEFSEIINLLPIIFMQLPIYIHSYKTSKLNDIPDTINNTVKHNGLTKNIINKEKASINLVSVMSVIISYIMIFSASVSIEENKTSHNPLCILTYFGFLYIITAYIFLRWLIYFKYIRNAHKTFKKQGNGYKKRIRIHNRTRRNR